ncbi:MAG TPA: alpha/beta hydrolase [Mycobacteriales bacterium]|jgi:pimeloyl-ACP methyl ester carboxylesterase|nr:alpha/beta hydrolase [Mycobacteriales bacterium]
MADEVLIDGRRVSLSRIGEGPPLVCLPGGPGFPGAHLGELGGVTRSRTLLRLDWRGAGDSEAPADGRHGVADYVADLAAVQDRLGLARMDLFGHSFGGIAAATYAAHHPERVARLVLDGTPDRLDDGRTPSGGAPGYFATWDDAAQGYLEGIMATLYSPAAEWFQANEFAACDLRPLLPQIQAPTFVLTGDQDWAAGTERATEMARAIPNGRAAAIAGAGHFAWYEQPDAYARAVLDFLA